MHLAGVQSRYRYLVYFLPAALIVGNTVLKVDLWFSTTSQIKNMMALRTETQRLQVMARNITMAVLTLGLLLFGTVLPIIYYDNKLALNWFYTFFNFYLDLGASILLLLLAFLNSILARKCLMVLEADPDPALAALAQKVSLHRSHSLTLPHALYLLNRVLPAQAVHQGTADLCHGGGVEPAVSLVGWADAF